MLRLTSPVLALLLLAGCVGAPAPEAPPPQPRPPGQVQQPPPTQPLPPPPAAGLRQPEIMTGPGLDGVIRQDAAALARQFGLPRLDLFEGDARKLQFASSACVLDIVLYPLQPGAEPVATWLQSRRPSDGAEVDYRACLQALRQR